MTEWANLISNETNIDDYHKKVFSIKEFNTLSNKIELTNFPQLRSQIYWLSAYLYRTSFTKYYATLSPDSKFELLKNNLIVFHPFSNISSEICKLIHDDYLYTSLSSLLCRQLIEQICIINEISTQNIETKFIVEACIEAQNRHLGAKSLGIKELNNSNKGILRVFSENIEIGKLAKKNKYGFIYNFFSGDIHAPAPIDKLIPKIVMNNLAYEELYLKCILSLLCDCTKVIDKYTDLKVKFDDLTDIDFVEIHD